MEKISVREILLQLGKWVRSSELAELIHKRCGVTTRMAYLYIKDACDRKEIIKYPYPDGVTVIYGLPEWEPPNFDQLRALQEAVAEITEAAEKLEKIEVQYPSVQPAVSKETRLYEYCRFLEQRLRDYIGRKLKDQYGEHWWTTAVPKTVQYDASKRQTQLIKIGEAKQTDPPINFITFGGLRVIFQKHWHIFKEDYKNQLDKYAIYLQELNKIRNVVIAHPAREATEEDIKKFEAFGIELLIGEDREKFKEFIKTFDVTLPTIIKKPSFLEIHEWIDHNLRFPRKEDFDKGLVYLDEVNKDLVQTLLISKRCVLLFGAPASRKTTFSLSFGLDMMKKGYRVFYLEIKEGEDINWNVLFQEIKSHDESKSIFIIDDCHKLIEKVYELIFKIKRHTGRAMFLFVSRKVSLVDPDYDYFTEFELEGASFELKPLEKIFEGIIRQFCIAFGIENYESKIGDVKKIMATCGNNVLLLDCLLRAWHDQIREGEEIETLSEMSRKRFFERMAIKLKLRERKGLFNLCALSQFEIPAPYDFLISQNVSDDEINGLLKEGLIFSVKSLTKECYIMSHSSFARACLECAAIRGFLVSERGKSGLSLEQYSANVLKEFILTQEPKSGYLVFQKIYSTKGESEKQILSYLLNDPIVWTNMKENVRELSLGQVTSLIGAILWISENKKLLENKLAYEVRSYYLKYNYRLMQEKLRSSSANIFRKYLPLLAKLKFDLTRFFSGLSILDFQEIIKRSTVSNVRTALFYCIEPKPYLYRVRLLLARKMAEALVAIPNEDLYCWINKNKSIYRLGGLIGNIRQVDESLGVKFVDKLSQMNLDNLFYEDDPVAKQRGFTKMQVLNFFLSRTLSFAPDLRERIINNIDEKALDTIIKQSFSIDEIMWFIWNIFRENPAKATSLVKNNSHYLSQILENNKESYFYPPLLGLLFLCGFDIQKFTLPEIEKINAILKFLREFGKTRKPTATAIVFLLLFLKMRLPVYQYNEARKILEDELVHKAIYSHFDPKSRKVLKNIIEIHHL
jgi:hypothetical protein